MAKGGAGNAAVMDPAKAKEAISVAFDKVDMARKELETAQAELTAAELKMSDAKNVYKGAISHWEVVLKENSPV